MCTEWPNWRAGPPKEAKIRPIPRGLGSFVTTPRGGSDETRYPEVTKLPVGGLIGLRAGSSSLDRAFRSRITSLTVRRGLPWCPVLGYLGSRKGPVTVAGVGLEWVLFLCAR